MNYDHIPRAGEVHASRIIPGDNATETIHKLIGVNAGAMAALVSLMTTEAVDPDAAPQAQMLPLEQLDALGIYEHFTYLLYNDICERNPARVRAVLRAVDLGILKRDELADAIERCRNPEAVGPKLNLPRIVRLVQRFLPHFDVLDQCKVNGQGGRN